MKKIMIFPFLVFKLTCIHQNSVVLRGDTKALNVHRRKLSSHEALDRWFPGSMLDGVLRKERHWKKKEQQYEA